MEGLHHKAHHPQRKMTHQVFPTNEHFEFIAMGILGLWPKTLTGNQFIIVITDKSTNLAWTIPSTKSVGPHVASIFFNHWILPYNTSPSSLPTIGCGFKQIFRDVTYVLRDKSLHDHLIFPSNYWSSSPLEQDHSSSLALLCCRTSMRFGSVRAPTQVPIQCPRTLCNWNDPI